MSSPNQRYLKHFGGAMLGYTAALFASVWVVEAMSLTGWMASVLSLTPMIPAFYALYAVIVRVRSMDEVQRRIVLEATLCSAGIVGFVSFGYGFLEGSIGAPIISMIWVLPALIGTYGVASIVLARRFK